MSIAQKLSWEIVALNEVPSSQAARTALEVAYGIALQVDDQPELFSAFMSSIIGQVTDAEMQRCLRQYAARGLKK